ncbi:MAG: ABC transporter permease [Oscillospiraceae bacterium]|jgi:simple sugar transport system permease protein|nr:ABC transporter permease [Oscillospiraceae bacterium]
MSNVNALVKNVGLPRIIIAMFLLLMFCAGPFFGIPTDTSVDDVLVRFGMNGVLVLSMIPMIQSGCGLNFGVPVGVVAGALGAVLSLELNLTGPLGILVAIIFGLFFGAVFGFGYGLILNRVKGDEMIIATYVGFSMTYFMCMMWISLPFQNPSSLTGYGGEGLRVTISVQDYWGGQLSELLKIPISSHLVIPTGMLLFFALMCFLMWGFFKTKVGTAITAVGSNPEFARASGISVDKMRLISVVVSTMVAAVGIIVYEQSFGFIQLYDAPRAFAFPSVAAILLGGASINKANITNVIVGTILFQGMLTLTPAVINSAIQIDASEMVRIIVSNGMIVYALTRKAR